MRPWRKTGKLFLDVELSDNNFVMAAQLVDETEQNALSEGVMLEGNQPGETVKLRFDLTYAQQLGAVRGRLCTCWTMHITRRSAMWFPWSWVASSLRVSP